MDLGDEIIERITLSLGRDLGYENLFSYCEQKLNCDSFEDKASIPVGYERINLRFPGNIYLSEEVNDYILKVVKFYNDKDMEVPYFMLGNYKMVSDNIVITIDKIVNCFDEFNASYCEAVFSQEAVKKVEAEISNGNYNFVLSGHSHPYVPTDVEEVDSKHIELIKYLRNTKSENGYRDGNLNITLKDLYSLVLFTCNIKKINKQAVVMSGIYHDNGELNFMYCDSEFYLGLATDVYIKSKDGSIEPIENFDTNNRNKVR